MTSKQPYSAPVDPKTWAAVEALRAQRPYNPILMRYTGASLVAGETQDAETARATKLTVQGDSLNPYVGGEFGQNTAVVGQHVARVIANVDKVIPIR